MARLIVCILLVVTGPARAEPPVAPTQNPSEPPNEIVIRLPLDNGRLEVRDVFETILRQAGIDPGERLSGIDWTIDLGSTLGRLQLRVFDRIADGAISTAIGSDEVVVTVDRRKYMTPV